MKYGDREAGEALARLQTVADGAAYGKDAVVRSMDVQRVMYTLTVPSSTSPGKIDSKFALQRGDAMAAWAAKYREEVDKLRRDLAAAKSEQRVATLQNNQRLREVMSAASLVPARRRQGDVAAVADEAGCDPITVSNYLSGKQKLSSSMKWRIRNAALTLGITLPWPTVKVL